MKQALLNCNKENYNSLSIERTESGIELNSVLLVYNEQFLFDDNGREVSALKYGMNELYFLGMTFMKRRLRKVFRIHPNKNGTTCLDSVL